MKRNLGLDAYRCLAIAFVLAAHSLAFFYSRYFDVYPLEYVLGLGVEIFFALSGFLIGGLLIRDVVEARGARGATARLASFYVRRWMRTLPLYYLLLLVTVLYPGWFGMPTAASATPHTIVANLVFIQNFRPQWLELQPVSWSLSIEEWFYLLTPLGMVAISLASKRSTRSRLLLGYALLIIVGVFAYRAADFLLAQSSWDFGTRKQIFMHLDALMFGVLVAWLKFYHAGWYTRLARQTWIGVVAAGGGVFLAARYVYIPIAQNTIDGDLFAHTLLLSLFGVCCAALVMTFESSMPGGNGNESWMTRAVRHVSTHSYGYYLLHWPIFTVVVYEATVHANASGLLQSGALNALALLATVVVGAVVYRLYEAPIMRLRDRIRIGSRPARQPASSATPVGSIALAASVSPAAVSRLSAAQLEEAAGMPITEQLPRVARAPISDEAAASHAPGQPASQAGDQASDQAPSGGVGMDSFANEGSGEEARSPAWSGWARMPH